MKCYNCDCCIKGFFKSRPNDYVCIGVKEPFIIENINNECSEYNKEYWDNEYKTMYKNIKINYNDWERVREFLKNEGIEYE